MLSTTKIYLDSRHALPSTRGTTSSIEVEIPGGIELKPNTKVWLSEFTCPASWNTIDDSNNTMYVSELGGLPRKLLLPTGPHDSESLRDAMEDLLNKYTKRSAMRNYIVQRASSAVGPIGLLRSLVRWARFKSPTIAMLLLIL